MKRWIPLLVTLVVLAGVGSASTIKNWFAGDALTSTDLNNNFNHIHSTMVGGHGARLVDADVSSAAVISHAKMATPGLIPKSYWTASAVCTADPCAGSGKGAITSVNWLATGTYQVNFSARPDAAYAAFANASVVATFCGAVSKSTTSFQVQCYTHAGALADQQLDVMFFDNDT